MVTRHELCGIVLAAGAGTRLRPLTELLPKALCPVANVALLDHAVGRVRPEVAAIAVNVHHHRDRLLDHLADEHPDVHAEVEEPEALGTAGAVGNLRGWIDGRPALVANADAWGTGSLDHLVDGWDGERIRLLVQFAPDQPDFEGVWRFAGASLLPWSEARTLEPEPSGLYEVCWRQAVRDGRLELVPTTGVEVDCGTPLDYLVANLTASGGQSVIGPGAVVEGRVERSVVWPGARVEASEHLRYAVRLTDGRTVRVASGPSVG